MKQQTTVLALCCAASTASAFTFITTTSNNSHQRQQSCSASSSSSTQLSMGLFDGVKGAFSAPPSDINSEKETPIDRWMGWSAKGAAAEANKGVAPGMSGMYVCIYLYTRIMRAE